MTGEEKQRMQAAILIAIVAVAAIGFGALMWLYGPDIRNARHIALDIEERLINTPLCIPEEKGRDE